MKDYPRQNGAAADQSASHLTAADRLDSWKEIAAYLKRDTRTVQRWEKLAALPVYRHAESRLRTAYAYRSELDAWWQAHRATVELASSKADATLTAARRFELKIIAVASAALLVGAGLVVAGAVGAWRRSPGTPADASAPTRTARVLLAQFANETGEPPIAPLLDEALERELGLQRVDIVPPATRARVLRLMRRAPDAPLTAALAREVAQRTAGGPLVISGRARKLTSTYLVGIDVVDPADGRIRATVEREVADRHAVHRAVHEEALEIARVLNGLSLATGERLEEVTTASLSALRLYSQAVAAGRRRHWPTAELLARRAVDIDPEFASAHAWIGWSMRNQGFPAADCVAVAERARALADGVTERERYLISGTYYSIRGDTARAQAAYEALVRSNPDDAHAIDRLIDSYARTGRINDAAEHAVLRANARPNDFYANVRAAHALRIWRADRGAAQPFLRRSRNLASAQAVSDRPVWSAWLTLLPAFERWSSDDSTGALQALAAPAASLESKIGRERDALSTTLGLAYLTLGRRQRAEDAFRSATTPTRQFDLALMALADGDERAARDWLLPIREYSGQHPELFARVGLTRDAELGLAAFVGPEYGEGITDVTRGFIDAAFHRTASAIDRLRRGIDLLRYSGEPEYFIAAESLARIWSARGDTDRARWVLSEAARQRDRTYGSARWSGAFWISVERDLMMLDRRIGYGKDAETERALLGRVLNDADPDHPVRRLLSDPRAQSGS